jgi:hypothetical protein
VRVSNSTKKIPFLFILKISFLLIFLLFLNTSLFFTGSSNSFRKVYAQQQTESTFKLYPPSGQVLNKDQGFVVDVLIDSGGQEVVSANFSLLFDPKVLQVKKAERNNSLFSQFPQDQASIDNKNGIVYLTGFTQSGTGTLYKTQGDPDIFARITFQVLETGETTLDWEYGNDSNFGTGIYGDGSPPQNILKSKPSPATFTIGEEILTPSNLNTGFSVDKYIITTGAILLLFGGFMVFSRPRSFRKKSGTVVIYDEDEEK